jgi:hypothetical protein
MSRTRRRSLPAVLVQGVWLAACEVSIADPDPPAMVSEVVAEFQEPTGQLSLETLPQVAAAVDERVAVIEAADNFSLLVNLSDDVASSTGYGMPTTGAFDTGDSKLLAVAKLDYVCRGAGGDDTVDPATTGRARMTGKVTGDGLFPVVWGTFERCIEPALNSTMVIDGRFFVMKRVSDAGDDKLYWFDGTIALPHLKLIGELAFVVHANGALELSVLGDTGNLLVTLLSKGAQIVRDRDDTWDCELSTATCRDRDTGNVVGLEQGP